MARWRDVPHCEPDFAGKARALFHPHEPKTVATVGNDVILTRPGAPEDHLLVPLWRPRRPLEIMGA
jgi:hypothetical protein